MEKKTFLIGVGILGGILLFMDARYKHEHPYQTTDTFNRHRHKEVPNSAYSALPSTPILITPPPNFEAPSNLGAWY